MDLRRIGYSKSLKLMDFFEMFVDVGALYCVMHTDVVVYIVRSNNGKKLIEITK